MKSDKYHRAILTVDEALESLYRDHKINNWVIDDPEAVQKFRANYNRFKADYEDHSELNIESVEELLDDVTAFHRKNQENWLIDEEYVSFDIQTWLLNQCKNKEQVERVLAELVLYKKYELYPVLRLMKYLVDKMRENNIIWGVGRGSSVCSYCLYLIGIHRIDSLKHNLDMADFLK